MILRIKFEHRSVSPRDIFLKTIIMNQVYKRPFQFDNSEFEFGLDSCVEMNYEVILNTDIVNLVRLYLMGRHSNSNDNSYTTSVGKRHISEIFNIISKNINIDLPNLQYDITDKI